MNNTDKIVMPEKDDTLNSLWRYAISDLIDLLAESKKEQPDQLDTKENLNKNIDHAIRKLTERRIDINSALFRLQTERSDIDIAILNARRVYINNNIKQGDIFNTDYFFSRIEGELVITKRVKDGSVIIHSVLDFYNLLREGCITINKEEGVKNESVAINNAKQFS